MPSKTCPETRGTRTHQAVQGISSSKQEEFRQAGVPRGLRLQRRAGLATMQGSAFCDAAAACLLDNCIVVGIAGCRDESAKCGDAGLHVAVDHRFVHLQPGGPGCWCCAKLLAFLLLTRGPAACASCPEAGTASEESCRPAGTGVCSRRTTDTLQRLCQFQDEMHRQLVISCTLQPGHSGQCQIASSVVWCCSILPTTFTAGTPTSS